MTIMNRRTLLKTAAAGGALLGAAKGAPQTAASKPKYKYIDDHVHLGAFYWGKPTTPENLIEWMDQNSIERATILPARFTGSRADCSTE